MEERTSITGERFFDELSDLLTHLHNEQRDNIRAAAQIVADTIQKDGVVHVFGSGHSYGFGVEMIGRPGALVPVHNICHADMVIYGKTSLEEYRDPNNHFERRSGLADDLFSLYGVNPEDCFIIISNSGINGLVIDMAAKAKAENHPVIVVTSLQHTLAEPSRHPSGKKLYEYGDVVIDNCGPRGDALLETDGPEKVCSVSSITGAFIAHGIAADTIEILENRGMTPPVLLGNDTPEHIAHDQALKDHYRGRI